MYRSGCINSCWSIQDIKDLEFVRHEEPLSGFNLESSLDECRYLSIGANIYRGLPDSIDNNVISNNFDWLDNKVYSVTLMYPGDILPLHRDRYQVYIERNKIQDIDNVVRCIIFLENRKHGHFLEIDGTNISDWKAGEWVSWKGSTLHLACNLGNSPRYTLQITGQLS